MADIDMIPRSYREGLRARRTLAAYGAALALLLVTGGGAAAVLRWRLAVETPQLAGQRTSTTQAEAMRNMVNLAQQNKAALADDVAAMRTLRGTGEVALLAKVLERALNDKVWFEQLRFARTQELVQAAPGAPLAPDTVQGRAAQGVPAQAWRMGSQVEIDGRALDNAAMTAFLGALAAEPALAKVRFLNSSTASADDGGAVTFNVSGALVKQVKPAGETP